MATSKIDWNMLRLKFEHVNSSASVQTACDIFRGYFDVQEHKTKTRNNQCLLKLPKIKTEYTRKSFRFMGAKIYNDLPIDIRKTESFNDEFIKLLKKRFS